MCGKKLEDHPDGRYCRRENAAQAQDSSRFAEQANSAAQREPLAGSGSREKGNGRGKRSRALPSGPKQAADVGLTLYDTGSYLGYDEVRYAVEAGMTGSANLVQYLAGEESLDAVCQSVAAGTDSLASLFATAASAGRLQLETLEDLDDSDFEIRQSSRPPGYSSQTILRFGGLDVTALLDSGATVSALPEEVAVTIIAHALQQVEAGVYDMESEQYPVVGAQRFISQPRIDGVAAGSPITVKYSIVLRAEFVPAGAKNGPVRALYFTVFPKGTCQVPGVIVGFPALDCEPSGLGWQVQHTVHTFRALGVSLPRLELGRKADYKERCKKYYSPQVADAPRPRRSDVANLCVERVPTNSVRATAVVDAGDVCLGPGERAIVPARWDRRVPSEDFWCEASALSSVVVEPGICGGSDYEIMLCVSNETSLEISLERGEPLAEAHEWIALPSGRREGGGDEALREVVGSTAPHSAKVPAEQPEAARSRVVGATAPGIRESLASLATEKCLDLAPQTGLPGETPAISEGSLQAVFRAAEVVFPREEDLPPEEASSVRAMGLVPMEIAAPPDGPLTGAPSIVVPAEEERRAALRTLNDAIRGGPWPDQWWSSVWHLTGTGQRDLAFEMVLPGTVGYSFIIVDGDIEEVSVQPLRGDEERWAGRRAACLMFQAQPAAKCSIRGVFSRGLFCYLERSALELPPVEALWLVDFGFRMPGVVSPAGSLGPRDSASAIAPEVAGDRVSRLTQGLEPDHEQVLWERRLGQKGRVDPIVGPSKFGNAVYHLVQDRGVIESLFSEELPPDEYYDKLRDELTSLYPLADSELLDHLVPVINAFDTATAFAMSFGIAKFQLAQRNVKLVGEIVGRDGRSPNPAIVRAIRNWPPVNTLKDLQCFLGTANYVRPHAGPAYSRIASPLRPLLKPGALFPPSQEQRQAIDGIKDLILEDHVLAVPDEFAAITAANRWLSKAAPEGRPFELAADTSGYAIGAVMGQATKDNGN